jgi:hypothetical protein
VATSEDEQQLFGVAVLDGRLDAVEDLPEIRNPPPAEDFPHRLRADTDLIPPP